MSGTWYMLYMLASPLQSTVYLHIVLLYSLTKQLLVLVTGSVNVMFNGNMILIMLTSPYAGVSWRNFL